MMRANFVVNIETETLLYRTDETDKLPVIYRKIDDETAKAIISGEIAVKTVVDAIENAEMKSPTFNWREYDAKRRAAKKMLNVSEKNMVPVSEAPVNTRKEDSPTEVVTLKDIIGEPAGGAESPKPVTAEDKAAAALGIADKPTEPPKEPPKDDEQQGEDAPGDQNEAQDGGEEQQADEPRGGNGGAKHVNI